MNIIHEIDHKKLTLKIDDPERAYSELNNLLSERMSYDKVVEVKHFQDVDEGVLRAKIEATEGMDMYTAEETEIFLVLKPDEMDIELKVEMVTNYDASGWRDNIIYYGYRAFFHKYLYADKAHHFEHYMEDKADELVSRMKDLFG